MTFNTGPYLAIYDWGIGGFGVYREVKALDPQLPILYFSDSGFKPYGKVEPKVLKRRVLNVLNFLKGQGCESIAVACNAASSVLEDENLSGVLDILSIGIEQAKRFPAKQIGVMGGIATVKSKRFEKELASVDKEVNSVIAQPLSALVEAGKIDGKEVEDAVNALLPRVSHCEAVVLACTHYPALLPVLKNKLPNSCWLDPARDMAIRLLHRGDSNYHPQNDRFLTTGDVEAMKKSALHAFGINIIEVESLPLELTTSSQISSAENHLR